MMEKPTQEESAAAILVAWDINKCPVPDGCDPRVVRPSIKRVLEHNGYRGPLTVTAFGKLEDVSTDILRALFSSGIHLIYTPPRDYPLIAGVLGDTVRFPPPANLMAIADPKDCEGVFDHLLDWDYNVLKPFPFSSLDTLIMEDSEPLVPETYEPPLWDCQTCARDPPGRIFDNLITHLSDDEHHELLLRWHPRVASSDMETLDPPVASSDMETLHPPVAPPAMETLDPLVAPPAMETLDPLVEALSEQLQISKEFFEGNPNDAVTLVCWDIKNCPVPRDCDPRRVGPCIKQFLENKGYSGPLKIIAIGPLEGIPKGILSGVYSSGISLYCANIVVISEAYSLPSGYAANIQSQGYNFVKPIPRDSFEICFPAESGALEEDKCSETSGSALLICSVCDRKLVYQDIEKFTTHVVSRRHQRMLLDYLPGDARFRLTEEGLDKGPPVIDKLHVSHFADMVGQDKIFLTVAEAVDSCSPKLSDEV
ncbi:hypothetical protein ISN44_As06g022220 [Arabidopsis suecica]|uniref:NYN domain-containing protein n=1 Tax=Arabidopsis suecica TaxID=45249 RepID=A0A8T2CI64_ARASU|nr:hypothetical protein ISN44_As06g022220 [Arabidopsis suecica]